MVPALLGLALLFWLHQHFFARGLGLDLNAMNTMLLLGAFLLWWLTVGPVRGFAFYLGVSTLLDLICAWFFMHPAVALATGSDLAQRKPRLFGMPDAPIVDGKPGTGRSSGRGSAGRTATTEATT